MSYPDPSARVEPAIDRWSLGDHAHDLGELIQRINQRAERLGTATLPDQPTPLIATGHQAQLWHPGILAKDVAMSIAAQRYKTRKLHIIVDQDTNEAWRLEVPHIEQQRLQVSALFLANQKQDVPTGFQAPADPQVIQNQLVTVDSPYTDLLKQVLADMPVCSSLAEQIAVVLHRLKQPYVGNVPVMFVSDLAGLPAYKSIVNRMLNDAANCADAYNRAVYRIPEAGMTPLIFSRELVELPLWAVCWNQPRRRVFADLADSEPIFVFENGELVDRDTYTLLPRALLLTAVMRSSLCDLFIHGTGGLTYDMITERWWESWTGKSLSPMAGATANLYLDLDVPVADRAQVDRAVWHHHHLPCNIDRELNLDNEATREKRELLVHMNDDRDRDRRRNAFKRIHQLNQQLAEQNPGVIESAQQELNRARLGLQNARIARKRDWCFALYPPQNLHHLYTLIANHPVQ